MSVDTFPLQNPVMVDRLRNRADVRQLQFLPAIADRIRAGEIDDVEEFLYSQDYLLIGTDNKVHAGQQSYRRVFGLLFGKAVPSNSIRMCTVEQVYLAIDVKAEHAFPVLIKELVRKYELDMARIFIEPDVDAELLASLHADGFDISDERHKKGGVVHAEWWATKKGKC